MKPIPGQILLLQRAMTKALFPQLGTQSSWVKINQREWNRVGESEREMGRQRDGASEQSPLDIHNTGKQISNEIRISHSIQRKYGRKVYLHSLAIHAAIYIVLVYIFNREPALRCLLFSKWLRFEC